MFEIVDHPHGEPTALAAGLLCSTFGEMALVTEPNFTANLDDAIGRLDEQPLRMFDAANPLPPARQISFPHSPMALLATDSVSPVG